MTLIALLVAGQLTDVVFKLVISMSYLLSLNDF